MSDADDMEIIKSFKLVESIKDKYDGVISCCSIYSPQAPITSAVANYFDLKAVICYGATNESRLQELEMPMHKNMKV